MNKSQHIHSPLDIHFGHIYFVHTNTTTDTLVPLLLSACVRISLGLLSGEGDWAMQSLQPQFCWVCQRLYTPSSIMRAWLLHTQDSHSYIVRLVPFCSSDRHEMVSLCGLNCRSLISSEIDPLFLDTLLQDFLVCGLFPLQLGAVQLF